MESNLQLPTVLPPPELLEARPTKKCTSVQPPRPAESLGRRSPSDSPTLPGQLSRQASFDRSAGPPLHPTSSESNTTDNSHSPLGISAYHCYSEGPLGDNMDYFRQESGDGEAHAKDGKEAFDEEPTVVKTTESSTDTGDLVIRLEGYEEDDFSEPHAQGKGAKVMDSSRVHHDATDNGEGTKKRGLREAISYADGELKIWWCRRFPRFSATYGRRVVQALFAEYICLFVFVLISVGAAMATLEQTSDSKLIIISLAHGLPIMVLVFMFNHVSGAHINPAVSLALALDGQLDMFQFPFYVIAQMLGGVSGAGYLYFAMPEETHAGFGTHQLNQGTTPAQGIAIEAALTFILVLAVFLTAVDKTNGATRSTGQAAIAIGMSVTMQHFVGVRYTGASMNPARSFGAAVVGGIWDDHYVSWVGPAIGAVVAWIVFRILRIGERGVCPAPAPVTV